jgi:hypothetical protein
MPGIMLDIMFGIMPPIIGIMAGIGIICMAVFIVFSQARKRRGDGRKPSMTAI